MTRLARVTRIPLLACAALLGACTTTPSSESGESGESETGYDDPIEHGAALYDKYCAFCHGDQGQGYTADNATALSNQEFLRIATDEFLANSVRFGRPGTTMSAWGEVKAGA